jgi:hypothetical protein
VTRRSGVATLCRRRGGTGEEKGGDDASWADKNLSGPKIEKIHMVDSAATNGQ